jgi:hypothetical protein
VSQVHSGLRRVLSSVKSYVSLSVNVEYDTQENNVVRMEVNNHVILHVLVQILCWHIILVKFVMLLCTVRNIRQYMI